LTSITLDRPLVFLCGPKLGKVTCDRRILLKTFIERVSNKRHIAPVPVIVDPLFDPSEVLSNGLDIALLEEIVANVSERTYIFLDSLSTSYEYGLFSHNQSGNSIVLFLDSGYANRINNSVGEFVKRSPRSKVINYSCQYDARGFISFPTNQVPSEIKNAIASDFQLIAQTNRTYPLKFTHAKVVPSGFGEVSYWWDKRNLSFRVSLKTLFYLEIFRKSLANPLYSSANSKDFIQNLLFSSLLASDNLLPSYFRYASSIFISLETGHGDINQVIKHVAYIAEKFNHVRKHARKLPRRRAYSNSSFDKKYSFSLFSFTKKSLTESIFPKRYWGVWDDYAAHPEDYVTSKLLTIKGKKRKIITYRQTRKGKMLAEIHGLVKTFFENCDDFIPVSYAYHEGKNTLDAIKPHVLNRFFLKLDVSKFFESISLHRLSSHILHICGSKWATYSDIRKLLSICFYHKSLPIGFVSSPILSDLYMRNFDKAMIWEQNALKVAFSRYADDLLVSSASALSLNKCEAYIGTELKKLLLNPNPGKRVLKELKNVGDSIKYLGVLLINRGNPELEIAISNDYIQRTSLLLNDSNYKRREEGVGRAHYIKHVSTKSYDKLRALYKRKTGKPFPLP
ncbi:MAG: reverse transcriptase domain-containing protein, partial [Bacilli bacterium]|nr:reverse transcriptase domain-containing protein [Bacilli bacterium]